MVIIKPGSITPHTQFEGEVYVLQEKRRGRKTPFSHYRPQFYVRTTDVTGTIRSFTADDGSEAEMVMPGDRIKMTVELINAQLPLSKECGLLFVKAVVLLVLVWFPKW